MDAKFLIEFTHKILMYAVSQLLLDYTMQIKQRSLQTALLFTNLVYTYN